MQRIGVAVALARWDARKCVSVARDQDVAVELPLHGAERLGVTPRNELVAMAQSELKRADFDHLALRQAVGHIGEECAVIEVSTNDMHIRGKRAQVVIGGFVDDVACTQDVLNFPRLQQSLEFLGQVCLAVRDVQIPNDEDEHLHRVESCKERRRSVSIAT